MIQTKGQFSAGKIYQAIKAWASKQFLVFNSEAAKDYFRFVLISEISEHDVGLEMLDNVYNGWTIRNSYSSLEICPVINNEEQYPIITVSQAKTTFSTVVEGVTPTANNHLATKSYIDTAISAIKSPHLYAHHYHFDHSGKGEVNFVIYSSKATELTNTELGDYLTALGCDVSYRAYPATGQSQYTGGIVAGIYAVLNTSTFLKYSFYVSSYTINGNYQEGIGNYLDTYRTYIAQIF